MKQPKIQNKRTLITSVKVAYFFCGYFYSILSTVTDGYLFPYHPSIVSRIRILSGSTNIFPRTFYHINRSKPLVQEVQNLHVHVLYSSLFHDDEFEWDHGHEEDEEFYKDDLYIQVDSLVQMQDEIALEGMDDTDDSYYEKLFLQQEDLSSTIGKFNADDQHDDNSTTKQEPQTQQLSNFRMRQNEALELSDRNSTSRLTYDDIVSLRNEWREKIDQMRNEAIELRKIVRQKHRHLKMKEYASFLALRALRTQSMMIQPERKSPGLITTARPLSETLPISSMLRTYSKETIEKMESPGFRLEKKLYGKRFQNAQKVFLRLLEVLDEMKRETKSIASEMITNRVEEELAMVSDSQSSTGNHSQSSMEQNTLPGNFISNEKPLEDIMTMNKNHHLRLRRVVHLSLNGHQENRIKLSDVDTEDLRAILRIRGNLKRRGRMPVERTKVLQCLEASLSLPLF